MVHMVSLNSGTYKCRKGQSVASAKQFPITQVSGQHGAEDTAGVGDHVVAPDVIGRAFAGACASRGEVFGEEDVELHAMPS